MKPDTKIVQIVNVDGTVMLCLCEDGSIWKLKHGYTVNKSAYLKWELVTELDKKDCEYDGERGM